MLKYDQQLTNKGCNQVCNSLLVKKTIGMANSHSADKFVMILTLTLSMGNTLLTTHKW